MAETALIVLAAGMGTRMKSSLPKVLHKAAGRSLLGHALAAGAALHSQRVVVVAGPDMDAVGVEAQSHVPGAQLVIQKDRKGTAHAVSMAKNALAGFDGVILVLYGDVPLITTSALKAVRGAVDDQHDAAVLGFEARDPTGYGRILQNGSGDVTGIREHLDATAKEREVRLCNSGIIAAKASVLWAELPKIRNENAKSEFYLTDFIELCAAAKRKVALAVCPEEEVAGVNDRIQLAGIEASLQARYRRQAMLEGATLVDPSTVYFSADTKIGRDVVIEPNVFFGPGVEIADDVTIAANSHIEGAKIGQGAKIGPFARLRPGAELGPKTHIGNFVEIKKSQIGEGAKVNHLTYIGDASVGAKSNIGAGTITCNYDGFDKHKTEIGANVFVGSNTALVAPVKLGDGVNIAAGSVITRDVPKDALAITRGEQLNKEGWAERYRALKQARKAQTKKG
jgi:bifunctional UDP-N-acetylglucosamine pyrophosphorylase / glucosamine-1-phosphate N-acetyltransferase